MINQSDSNILLKPLKRCPYCGVENRRRLVYRLSRFSVYRCSCGGKFIDPALDQEGQMQIYQSSGALARVNSVLRYYYEYDKLKPGCRTRRDYDKALQVLKKLAPGSSLIEAGCGDGSFLRLANENGFSVTGIDSSIPNITQLRKEGIKAECGDFMAYEPAQNFDAVVLWDLIEHPWDPAALLDKCRKILKKGGVVLIATPHDPNLVTAAAGALYRLSGGRIHSPLEKFYVMEHTTYFNAARLSALMSRVEMKMIKAWQTDTDIDRYALPGAVKLALKSAFLISRPFNLRTRLMAVGRYE